MTPSSNVGVLLVGLPLIVVGCASTALGFALMKRSGEVEAGRPPWLAWRWLLGFLCLAFLQTICDAASLSVLPLSVVAPFAGLTIVFSLLIAATGILGNERESLSRGDLAGTTAVLVGVTCVSLAAPHESHAPTLADVQSALQDPTFAVPAGGALVAAAACLVSSLASGWRHPVLAASGAASCGAISQFAIKTLSLSVRDAVGGGGSLLALLSLGATPLLGLGLLAFAAPTQLALLNVALAARASLVVPLYQASLVSLTTLTGGVAFHEFREMAFEGSLTYGVGLLVATAGLALLSSSTEAEAADAADEEVAGDVQLQRESSKGGVTTVADAAADAPPASTEPAEGKAALLRVPLLRRPAAAVEDEDDEDDSPRASLLVRRTSRVAGPGMLLGLGVAVQCAYSTLAATPGRTRASSDGRAISRARAEARAAALGSAFVAAEASRGRSASTLT